MRRKMARSAPPPPFGPPGVAAVVRAASLACQNVVKAQKFVPLQESSEESRLRAAVTGFCASERRIAKDVKALYGQPTLPISDDSSRMDVLC